jgi:hypothetical protein
MKGSLTYLPGVNPFDLMLPFEPSRDVLTSNVSLGYFCSSQYTAEKAKQLGRESFISDFERPLQRTHQPVRSVHDILICERMCE